MVAALEAKEVYVHDFHWAKGIAFSGADYSIDWDPFWNDFRDEKISKNRPNELAKEAHLRGLEIGYQNNIAFVKIGKYIGSSDIDSGCERLFRVQPQQN